MTLRGKGSTPCPRNRKRPDGAPAMPFLFSTKTEAEDSVIRFVSGDLFAGNYDAIVNTVNCVGVMGKGIALQFKQRYPQNFLQYREACGKGRLTPGGLFVTHDDGCPWILNMATKNHWRYPSRLDWIRTGAWNLATFLAKHPEIHTVGMPKPGCANGGLSWEDVRPILVEALSQSNAVISIYGEAGVDICHK